MSRLIDRIFAHWPVKLFGGASLTLFFCTGYFGLQRYPIFPPARLPEIAMDRAVAFSPAWAWVYQSVYPLMTLAWLVEAKEDLHRYFVGFVSMSLLGFVCFAVWPIQCPRPAQVPEGGMYGLLVSYDGTINCFPSLHMALATYTACVVIATTSGPRQRTLTWLFSIWIGLIGFSTLATKQHYFVDLPVGVALGWATRRWIWATNHRPRSEIRVSGVQESVTRA